jgi:hypothetical protein
MDGPNHMEMVQVHGLYKDERGVLSFLVEVVLLPRR